MGKISMTVCDTERGVKKLEMCHGYEDRAYEKVTFQRRNGAMLIWLNDEHVYSTCSSTASLATTRMGTPYSNRLLGMRRGGSEYVVVKARVEN